MSDASGRTKVIVITRGMLNRRVIKRADEETEQIFVGVQNAGEEEQQVDMNVWDSVFDNYTVQVSVGEDERVGNVIHTINAGDGYQYHIVKGMCGCPSLDV